MRIIALMPVRNEDWILNQTLKTLCSFCDLIIVADQRSTDETDNILKRYSPKVAVIDNREVSHSTKIRWRLLDEAREYQGQNFIILADADEIFTSNITDPNVLEQIVGVKPGTGIEVPWIQLWRSPFLWRDDASVWSRRYMTAGFRDDRCVRYGPITGTIDHNKRIPDCRKIERINKVKLLHFQFVLFDRMLSKQRWYRTLEALEFGKGAEDINQYYCITRDERCLHLEPIEPEWTAGWKETGVDLENFQESPLYWYDVEVLRYFAGKGAAFFAPLDVWEVDWEEKRLLAKAQGHDGIPDEPIADPRTLEQRLYHAYLDRFFRTPPWRDPRDLARMPGRWGRALLGSTGLRRSARE
jgi:glycosyltransferase involved in cell wall biosynthesis